MCLDIEGASPCAGFPCEHASQILSVAGIYFGRRRANLLPSQICDGNKELLLRDVGADVMNAVVQT